MSAATGALARFKEYERRARAEPPRILPEDLPGLRLFLDRVIGYGDITPPEAEQVMAAWKTSAAAYALAADAGEDL